MPSDDTCQLHPETLAIRAGRETSEYREHSQSLHLTSSFTFDSAAQAAAMFLGEIDGYTYSRFTNPTVSAFQQRLAAMEGAERAVATSTGMAAIQATMLTLLKAGDHIVSSRSLFGSTINLFNGVLGKFGVETSYVDAANLDAWRAAVKPNTKVFFLETPSNPLTDLADIAAVAAIAHEAGALLVVDNCFCSPALQQPIKLGADLVVHSATKYLDGHGRVMGGAVVGSDKLVDSHCGPVAGTVQCLGIAVGSGNAVSAHGKALRQCPGAGQVAATATGSGKSVLSRLARSSALRAGTAPAKEWRPGAVVPGQGRARGCLEGGGCYPADIAYRQPGRRENHADAPGFYYPCAHYAGGAGTGRHYRRFAARCSGAGTC